MARKINRNRNNYVAPVETKEMIIAKELAKAGYGKHLLKYPTSYHLLETKHLCSGNRFIQDWRSQCEGFKVVQMYDNGRNARNTVKWHEEKRWCQIYKHITIDNKHYYVYLGDVEGSYVESIPDEIKQTWKEIYQIVCKLV